MKIAVIGKSGQLAWELDRIEGKHQIRCFGRSDIDLTDANSISQELGAFGAEAVINASAYTAVDLAESEQEQAYALNADAVEKLAIFCQQQDLPFVHISTDYVFGGDKGSPYQPSDSYEPQGVYGASKAEGEKRILAVAQDVSCIIRTSWVYSSHGNNFVKTMLRLMQEKPQLGVIDDQIGSPTWAKGLALVCISAVEQKLAGVHHCSDAGVCSWYDFALAIQELGAEKGLLDKVVPVNPIPTSAYPTPAKRPSYSVLSKATLIDALNDVDFRHWRVQLSSMLDELR